MLKAAAVLLIVFTANAFAQETFPAIPPSHPDHDYYQRAADIDQAFVNERLIDNWFPYDSDAVLRRVPGQAPVEGRIVTLLDGPKINPRNLVLTVNGRLYYVRTDLNAIGKITLVRRWQKDEDGFFLVMRGERLGGQIGEHARVTITLRLADRRGVALPEVEYVEDRLPH